MSIIEEEFKDEICSPKKSKSKKIFITLLKASIAMGLLYLVLSNVDLEKIATYIKDADILYLILALIILNIGQAVSAMRMRFYFSTRGLVLSRPFAISIYYIGMMFNLILPGGVGGDGYIAYYMQKKKQFSWKTSIRLMISGRGSGMLMLIVLTFLLAFLSPYIMEMPYAIFLTFAGIILVFPCYSFLAKKLLKENFKTQIRAGIYSLFVQTSVLITVILILKSIGYSENITEYLVLFMISGLVSVLPISIGGIGLREATFFYGAPFLLLDPDLGVTISIMYFTVNLVASLLGGTFFYYCISKIK